MNIETGGRFVCYWVLPALRRSSENGKRVSPLCKLRFQTTWFVPDNGIYLSDDGHAFAVLRFTAGYVGADGTLADEGLQRLVEGLHAV